MRSTQTLLEREPELDLLASLLADVDSTGGEVVLIRGEAGIGKTALVREFVNRVGDQAHIHVGWCDDLLTPQPLGPFWDMGRSEQSLSEALASSERMTVLDALVDLMSRRLRPTVMVVEDTQWADEATLDAIKYLGRRIEQANGLLVLTYREGEVDYEHPLRIVIGELSPGNLVRIHLVPLSVEAVAAMSVGRDVELDQLMELTDGNPLFVTEMLAFGSKGVPLSVRDSVLARASKLSPGAREVLNLISVVPGETENEIIDRVLDPTPRHLAEGIRQGLIEAGHTTVGFRHELTRRAIESALDPDQRRWLNNQVLGVLVAAPESTDPARLVHHARVAGDVEAVVEYAPRAARAARAVESHAEAVAHFGALEPYLDQIKAADRAAILEDWAHSEMYLDDYPRSISTLNRAIDLYGEIGADVARARALTFATRLYEISWETSRADRCLREALTTLEALPPTPELAFAVSQQAWILMMRGDDLRAGEAADRAVILAERTGAESALVNALNTKGAVTYRHGDPTGMELLEEARRRAVVTENVFEEVRALHNMSAVAYRMRDLGLAHELAQRTVEAERGHKLPRFSGEVDLAWILELMGEWSAAEELAVELLATIHPAEPKMRTDLARVLGRLETRYGRPQARATLERAWSAAVKARRVPETVVFAAPLAECMWVTGDVDDNHIEDFLNLLDEVIQLGYEWDTGELALWLWKLGELTDVPDGIAEPYRLVMSGDPTAAAAIWKERGYPYERAIALSHGDTDARLQALEILETLGATAVADKLRHELREEGVPLPRRREQGARDGVGLTTRQSEVLGLLAEDLSNLEIADRLFLSPRTVEHHVAAVMSKLNASSRDEAVELAEGMELFAR